MNKKNDLPATRRSVIKGVALAGGSLIFAPLINRNSYQLFAATPQKYSKKAIDLVAECLVIDMLSLFDMPKLFTALEQGGDPYKFTRQELMDIKAAGINVFHPAYGIDGPNAHEDALEFMAGCNGLAAEHPDLIQRVTSLQDLREIKISGKMGVILGVQNSDHFRTVEDVEKFYSLGQRVSQLTYNSQNLIGTGSTDRVDGGVSDYGAQIIEAMNDIGMAVDVSHCGDKTTLDAFSLSRKPVLITHSNARALTKGHPRCKPDSAIRAMAKSGGVMGITGVRNFLKNTEPTTLEDYIDHIDHVVKIAGMDHVGIGTDSDLNGYDDLPPKMYKALKAQYKSGYGFREKIDTDGLDHPHKIFELTDALIDRGYSDDNIRAILGGNFKRVLGEIWAK